MYSNIAVIIPSLNPDAHLLGIVKELTQDFSNILIVNDGSSEEYNWVYEKAANLGKFTIVDEGTKIPGGGYN